MRIGVDGITINYMLEGPASKPVVTFSHSLGANMSMWDDQARFLSDEYRVLRYDIRGHGGSDTPDGPYTIEALSEDVRRLLKALGIARTHFVGLSLGGLIGQTLALDSPDVVTSLVLSNTTSCMPPASRPMWDERSRIALSEGMNPIAEMTVQRWLTDGFRTATPKAADRVREMILATNPAGYVACYRAIEQFDVTERLRDLQVSTLIIAGRDDEATPVATAKEIHVRISGSDFLVLAPAAHLSNIEQPKQFSEAVLGFIGKVDRHMRTGDGNRGSTVN